MGLNKKQIDNIMNILQEAEKNKTKLPSLTMQPTDSSKKLSDVTKNLQSTATRLQSVGVDTNALTDTRNPLEKALNLTEDQNFLFDILETINRPQQAIFGAITAAQTGGDVGKDFMAGLTGEKETFGGDIIRNITGGQKTEGLEAFTDWQNWAGFALDVMLDPADLGLAIITGGGSLAVQGGAELVDTAGDVARTGAKTLDKLGGLQDVLLGKGNRLVIPKSPGEYVKMLADKNYRAVNAMDKASLTSMTFKSLGAGFKTGTALADSILESTMSKLDTQGQTLSAYRALKKGIVQSVDDMGAYVKRARSAGNERYNTTMESLAPVFNSFTDKIKKVALETGLSEEEVAIRTMRAYEGWFLKNRNLDPDSFLDFITKTPYKFLPDEEKTLESIRKIFGDDAVGAIERVTLDGMPVLRFDETFWNKANLENISKFRDDAPAKALFSKGDREAYEDALRRTNPEKLDEYDAKRMAYERELAGRVTKQYEQTYPEDYTRKTIAERKKAKAKIRRQIEKADLASGRHPQNLLDEALPTGTGGLVYRTAKERQYDFNRLSMSDQSIAKNIRGEIRQRVDDMVAKTFPASNEPVELSAKKEYIANRKKFAQSARKELMKEYDDFLIKHAPKGTEVVQEVAEEVAGVADDVTETVAKNAPEATPNTYPRDAKVELGTFYTDEQLEQLAKDFETPWIKDMIDYYDGVITKTQRIIGEMEFGDAEALVRDSMKGYTTHAPSADVAEVFKNIKEKYKMKDLDYSYFAPGRTQALKGRQYFGSAMEANNFRTHYFTELLKNDEWVKTQLTDIDDEALEAMEEYFKMDLFSEDARTSLGTMMTKVYSSINHNHKTTEMAIAMSFGKAGNEHSAFKVIKKGVGQPDGYRVLANDEIQKLRSTIRETKRFAGGGMFIDALAKQLDEGLADANQAVMDSHLYNMWKTMGNKDAKNAFAMMDMFNQAFKVGKTLSPSFNVKNLFSNMSNFWLSGADAPDVFRYWNKSVDASKKMVAINDKVVKGGLEALTGEEAKLYQIYKEFLDNGFMSKQTLYRLNDLDTPGQFQFKANKITKGEFDTLTNNPVTRANMEMNLWIDNRMRLGLYMYAKDHPEYLRRLGFDPERTESAMKAVRMVLFDPNDLTFFEDDIMKRLVPFYTFTRQNLAFQMKNLALNSERYYKVYKAYNGWNKEFMNLDKEDLQKYQVDQLYVPVFSKKDGSYVTLKTGIAMTALSELTLDPIDMTQNVVSKLTPLIKMPFERATGIQTFTGRPIEDYKGQPSTNIPGVSKGTEWLLSQVGADVPLRGAAGVVSAVSNLAQGNGGEAVDSLLQKSANLTTSIDPAANEVNTKYRKLDILNEKLKALKAGGTNIPTISEIQAKALDDTQQGRIAEMQAITDMIRNIKR